MRWILADQRGRGVRRPKLELIHDQGGGKRVVANGARKQAEMLGSTGCP